MMPTNTDEAREIATGYVRDLLARGYSPAEAAKEIHMGYGGPAEAGWTIAHGKITVPGLGQPKWTFSFAQLATEIEQGNGQMMLF